MPLVPPVINAILPLSLLMIFSECYSCHTE
jgi:hypothetical protein